MDLSPTIESFVPVAAGAVRQNDPPQFADLASLRGNPASDDCEAELLVDGPEAYEAMLQAIARARFSVLLEIYIFADDPVGRRFAEALEAAVARGVAVHLIFDSLGSVASDAGFFTDLGDAGVKLVEYNPARWWKTISDPLRLNRRDHRKLLVVDDEVAFVGGINLTRTYSSSSFRRRKKRLLEEGWRDTHMAVRGPLVAEFRDAFARHWRATRTPLAPPQALPALPAKAGDDRVCLLDSYGNRRSRSPIRLAYEEAIARAQSRVWLTQAYFIPDRSLIDCLGETTARGADVRLLVAGPTDSVLAKYASDAWYEALLTAGVRVYELETAVLHAKTAVIDGYWSTVGSCNLDDRSAWQNDEMNAVVLSRTFGTAMERLFQRDLGCAREVTADAWRERHLGRRAMERACRLVSPWL